MRPLLSTLAGAGLRIGEACALEWRDVNLSRGTLRVRESKTAAGAGREVDLPIGLQEARNVESEEQPDPPRDPVFVPGLEVAGRRGRRPATYRPDSGPR